MWTLSLIYLQPILIWNRFHCRSGEHSDREQLIITYYFNLLLASIAVEVVVVPCKRVLKHSQYAKPFNKIVPDKLFFGYTFWPKRILPLRVQKDNGVRNYFFFGIAFVGLFINQQVSEYFSRDVNITLIISWGKAQNIILQREETSASFTQPQASTVNGAHVKFE